MITNDELLKWRPEFPTLEKTVYLISNSLGAMPKGAYEALREYADTWASRGVRAWAESWWEMPIQMGDLLCPILGVKPGEISFHPNVTLAEATILSCFDFDGRRRKVVYTNMEFPSLMYLYQAQRSRGADIHIVSSDDGIRVDLARLLEAIDEETLLVPVSHVLFKSAYIQDARSIIRRAHEVGAHVVLDIYQSAGTVPLNLAELKVDFAVGGCLKWLCGGPGAAFLYVRPDLQRLMEPKLTGWMAHQDSFAFETGDIKYRNDGFRFLNGTPNIPALYAARRGLEIIGQIGVDSIRRKSQRQIAYLIELAHQEGFLVVAPEDPEERGGTIAINLQHAYEVSRELLQRDLLVDYRPGAGIRISPHFYTSDEELERLMREIRVILESKAFEKHVGVRSYVT